MAGEKRFRTSFFGGFKKDDVNAYIEKILREFEEKLKEKDNQISALKRQFEKEKSKYDEIAGKTEEISRERAKVAEALIKAQEKAENIIEDARARSVEEKRQLEEIIEKEKEKIVDIKEKLKLLKGEAVNVLRSYEGQLNNLIEQETKETDFEDSYMQEAAANKEFVANENDF